LGVQRQALGLLGSHRASSNKQRYAAVNVPGGGLRDRPAFLFRERPDRPGAAEDDDPSGAGVDEFVYRLAQTELIDVRGVIAGWRQRVREDAAKLWIPGHFSFRHSRRLVQLEDIAVRLAQGCGPRA